MQDKLPQSNPKLMSQQDIVARFTYLHGESKSLCVARKGQKKKINECWAVRGQMRIIIKRI